MRLVLCARGKPLFFEAIVKQVDFSGLQLLQSPVTKLGDNVHSQDLCIANERVATDALFIA